MIDGAEMTLILLSFASAVNTARILSALLTNEYPNPGLKAVAANWAISVKPIPEPLLAPPFLWVKYQRIP